MRSNVAEQVPSLFSISDSRIVPDLPVMRAKPGLHGVVRVNHPSRNTRRQSALTRAISEVSIAKTSGIVTLAQAPTQQSKPCIDGIEQTQRAHQTLPLLPLKVHFSDAIRVSETRVQLPAVAGKSLVGEISIFQNVHSLMHKSAFRTVDAKLGTLTHSEFDAVHRELGGRSQVHFDSARQYTLTDFLPPAVQALVNKDLVVPQPVTLTGSKVLLTDRCDKPEDLQVGLTMNCHATAYEAVRAYQGAKDRVAIFYGEMITMDSLVNNANTFKKMAEFNAAHVQDLLHFDLRPGDLIQFHEVAAWQRLTMLLHSAVYAGGGVFFEKPNTEGPELTDPAHYVRQDQTPFRLAILDDLVKPVYEVAEGKFRVVVLRAQSVLEDAAQVFQSTFTEPLMLWAQSKGRELGVELVPEYEQGTGGNIVGECASAMVRIGLRTNEDGTTVLAE